ncbi:hypothetical protein Kpol_1041p9 [Vanderwaltozyma polyspora DSM 70294]|uniref:Protein kinase domain-containing protein n=1 Tax=Vanderwaltozyma polyspora (strain ATCC 22028 / DSM 70294 / BCRC 21397 / CBS 2163 / NBRC 10782 / NRRL Y-8283 / UCD 57-17) TaxID=436907 RepID=A7TL76_VANPO|nr:uncharacterized protein Kpol_1041p9 [Vanderwaltozyma polyspora DSM 70294]EDO16951.1 hypothetical protein Kpol_1041p9 [Vanderwaltozyma polyspora DSM 70294]
MIETPFCLPDEPIGNENRVNHDIKPIATRFILSNVKSKTKSMGLTLLKNLVKNNTNQRYEYFKSKSELYDELKETLGKGSGGSVKIVRRKTDDRIFAAKIFRHKSSDENHKEYFKKITNEYCISSTLNHQNVINTLHIVYDRSHNQMIQIQEYCEYDLFSIVVSQMMTYKEIKCCFKQILHGVQYLHGIGIAHRDLKLDNCVITKNGTVKIIDFGVAMIYRDPPPQTTKSIIMSTGIVGSDPYIPPEVYMFNKYDPRAVDIWSLSILFVCMYTRRFPWKGPHLNDESFQLFCQGRGSRSLKQLLTCRKQSCSHKRSKPRKHTNGSGKTEEGSNIVGPEFLLQQIPAEARGTIDRMCRLAPSERIGINELLEEDEWLQEIEMCSSRGIDDSPIMYPHHHHTQVSSDKSHMAKWRKNKT